MRVLVIIVVVDVVDDVDGLVVEGWDLFEEFVIVGKELLKVE